MYIKINNLIQKNGVADYKGLDLNLIIPGTQIYPATENTAYFYYNGEKNENADVLGITESEYMAKKSEDESNLSISAEEEIKLLKQENLSIKQSMAELAELILGGM